MSRVLKKLLIILLLLSITSSVYADFTPPTSEYDSDVYTKLLLHCNGTDGSTTIPDSGNTDHGNATITGSMELDTAQKQFGSASLLCGGGWNDHIDFSDHADWDFGSGDFTIDCWVRFDVIEDAQFYFFHRVGSGIDCYLLRNDQSPFSYRLEFLWYINSTDVVVTTGAISWTADQWYHVAVVRSGDDYNIYLDGVSEGSVTDSDTLTNTNPDLYIGRQNSGSDVVWVDEYRISKGIARDWVSEVGQFIWITEIRIKKWWKNLMWEINGRG